MVLYDAVPSQAVASAYGGARAALLAMLFVNALGLLACYRITSRWSTLMETSGFVDWPALPSMEFQTVSFAIPVLVSIGSMLTMASDLRRACTVSINVFIVAAWLVVAVSLLGIFTSLGNNLSCPEVATAGSLATQHQAVTRFNRGYCEAWCRADPKELTAQTKSECDPDEKTVFDDVVDVVRINEWCRDAVTYRKYDTNAVYSGLSPFMAMQQQADECYVTDLSWQLTSIVTHVLTFPASAVLAYFCVSYWRDRSWRSRPTAEPHEIAKFR